MKNMSERDKTKLSKSYEAMWHKFFYALPQWKKDAIINDPLGRYADELAHEVALDVERKSEDQLVPSGVL